MNLKSFSITAKINIESDITISALDLEDALKKSKELDIEDFIEFKGEWIDGDIEINGIFKNG